MTLGVEVGLEPMPRQRAEVGMGRRENKLKAPRELAGLPTQLLGSVSRSWKSWAHPAPLFVLEASPQPEWEKAQRLFQPHVFSVSWLQKSGRWVSYGALCQVC